METRFHKHYTLGEARQLLPQVRRWLEELMKLRGEMEEHEKELAARMTMGADLGGPVVNASIRCMADFKAVLLEFIRREIQVKDLERGLIDFPAFLDDKEVFLCWEKGEADIGFWHELDAGYAGRQRLEE